MISSPSVVPPPDSDQFTVIDEHYAQVRSDREALASLRARQTEFRQAGEKLLQAARLIDQECQPIEERLSKTREFCTTTLSRSPPSRAHSVVPAAMQLAAEAMPVLQRLPSYANGTPVEQNGYAQPGLLQYVNAPATPPSPEHPQKYEHYSSNTTPGPSSALPIPRTLKRSHSMIDDEAEDELEDDDVRESPTSSNDKMVMKLAPNQAPPRKQGKFTEDDRHKIAAYLATTAHRAQNGGIDWKHFAIDNPKYDATGWRTQYHSRKHKIEPLIENYKATTTN